MKFEHAYVTPQTTSPDPRMVRAIDGWLGLYEACYVLDRAFKAGAVVADGPENYGIESSPRPQPSHLLAALIHGAAALNQWSGQWILGGGLAMNYYGRDRATRDIDFFVFADKDQLDPVVGALAQNGLRLHTLEQPSFMPPDAEFWWVPLQYGLADAPPVDVDLLVASHEFMAFLHASGVETSINGQRLRVAGIEALLILKIKAYRDQDKADVQALLRTQRGFDRELVRVWLEEFGIAERLSAMEIQAQANDGRRMG